MDASVIHYRLDLLIRLIDTTTGFDVEERDVQFWRDGRSVKPVPRGSGNYVFLNCGRENSTLDVTVFGYDPCSVQIRYEELDSQLPIKEVFLIPSENTSRGLPVITFSGRIPGLTAIEAVSLSAPRCCISSFDERKRIMKLFKTHRAGMEDIFYGLIHPDRQNYESFEVMKEISEDSVKIREPLKEPFSVNSPIARIIFGRVTPEGDFCIRVRDDSERLLYLVRYVKDDKNYYQTADFHNLKEAVLE